MIRSRVRCLLRAWAGDWRLSIVVYWKGIFVEELSIVRWVTKIGVEVESRGKSGDQQRREGPSLGVKSDEN